MLDPRRVEQVARSLAVEPGLIEKDWHVVRALAAIAAMDHGGAPPVFSGGTSLSKGWDLIKRFSEDIDFKVGPPDDARSSRRAYRNQIVDGLAAAGFTAVGTPIIGNESRFYSGAFAYPTGFPAGVGLRPHLRVEITFVGPALPPVERPIRSIIAATFGEAAEVESFPCVDPVETAADKLSALAWRVLARDRAATDDDPTIIRHLHDLAALESIVTEDPRFRGMARRALDDDARRGGAPVPQAAGERVAAMLQALKNDPLWSREYDDFVAQVSFAPEDAQIAFNTALAACERLAAGVPP